MRRIVKVSGQRCSFRHVLPWTRPRGGIVGRKQDGTCCSQPFFLWLLQINHDKGTLSAHLEGTRNGSTCAGMAGPIRRTGISAVVESIVDDDLVSDYVLVPEEWQIGARPVSDDSEKPQRELKRASGHVAKVRA